MKELNKAVYFAEDLTKQELIDDNSLYVYKSILNGRFSANDSISMTMFALVSHPLGWENWDVVSFLIAVIDRYNLDVGLIKAMPEAIADDYLVTDDKELERIKKEKLPLYKWDFIGIDKKQYVNHYTGAYAWAKNYIKEKKPFNLELQQVLKRFLEDKITVEDIIYAHKNPDYSILSPEQDHKQEYEMAKELFNKMMPFITIQIDPKSKGLTELYKDVNQYIFWFIEDKLSKRIYRKHINNTDVYVNTNTLTFQKHHEQFLRELERLSDRYGIEFTMHNTFEKLFITTTNDEQTEKYTTREEYRTREFLFFHILFACASLKEIEIVSLGSNWTYHEDQPPAYNVKIKLLPVVLEKFGLKTEKISLKFDAEKSRLYVNGKEVKVKKFGDEYHTLRIIFENSKDLKDEWFFSRIAEKYDSVGHLEDKKFYNAVYQINLKCSRVGIDDFFLKTRQSAKINSKYLS
ncbi:MAG: hypothetical protein WCK48_01790 [bacterium]